METISALLAICAVYSPVPGDFPAQRPVTRSFDVSLICTRINGWVNNGDAGDLRRHRAHYDVTVMDMTVCRPTHSGRCAVQINVGHFGLNGLLCDRPYFIGVKQCTFHRLVSSELVKKWIVFNSFIIHHIIMITCISYGNIFAILVPKYIDISPL